MLAHRAHPRPLPPLRKGEGENRPATSPALRIRDSRTQPDAPMRRRPAAKRAIASASRSPRFVGASAWISSMTTACKSSKKTRACSDAMSRQSCSGVVSRMSGGCARWRWRLCARRIAGARFQAHAEVHLAHRRFEIARDVGRQRFQRRNVERVQLVRPLRAIRLQRREIDQARQKARQRLARAGRRDQQRREPLTAPGGPAPAGAPAAPSRAPANQPANGSGS